MWGVYMSNEFQDSSYRSFTSESLVSNAVFLVFMVWLLFSKNQWGHFVFFLAVGNSWTDCTHDLSFLPHTKNHPSFWGVEKEFVWFESFFCKDGRRYYHLSCYFTLFFRRLCKQITSVYSCWFYLRNRLSKNSGSSFLLLTCTSNNYSYPYCQLHCSISFPS